MRSPATIWSLLFSAVIAVAVFFSGSPQAQDDSGVREAVQNQMQAFAAEDAGKAFALADPTLRTRFDNAQEFLDTVRTQYPMVLHPVNVLFLKPESDGSVALQKVRITDAEGSYWLVTYLLNRQRDDRWLISACLVEPDGRQVTA